MAFRLPTRVLLTPGCRHRLPEVLAEAGACRVLLVTDPGLSATPWPAEAEAALRAHGHAVSVTDAVEPNPRHTTVEALARQARADAVDAVVGLGGGSVLDAAKAAALLARNPGGCRDYEGRNRFAHAPMPFFALPTTCGTGSEVTWVSVITHADEKRKMSLKGDGMFPTAAFVDADLLATLPAGLVATTGLDALTHALEAYTGTAANPVSDALAEKAIVLLMTHLRRAHRDIEDDAEAREAVMRAATLAGIAFGNADVGAVHCLSETIGGRWDLPHGLLNALLLVPVLQSHFGAIVPRLAALFPLVAPGAPLAFKPKDRAARFLDALALLVHDLGLPSFATLALPADAFPEIAAGAVQNNSNASNPRPMDAAAYRAILEGLA